MKNAKTTISLALAALFAGLWTGCGSDGGSSSPSKGSEGWCETAGNCGTFTDARDGRSYKWTKIGNQVWMAENLDFGAMVAAGDGGLFSKNQSNSAPDSAQKWCYDDDAANCEAYGGLYQWHTAMGLGSDALLVEQQIGPWHRGICPEGWHVPSFDEWMELHVEFFTGVPFADREDLEGAEALAYNRKLASVATKLKDVEAWGKGKGTDDYAFSALPGGHRSLHIGGTASIADGFADLGAGATWWSTVQYDDPRGAWFVVFDESGFTAGGTGLKTGAASLRCLKNGGADFGGSSETGTSSADAGASEAENSSSSEEISSSSATPVAWCDVEGNCGTFTEARDSQSYKWTKVGSQTWMAQNLNFGTTIEGAEIQGPADTASADKWCHSDVESYCTTFGGLYEWHTAMGLDSAYRTVTAQAVAQTKHRGICPEGWHLPTSGEFQLLIDWVDEANGGVLRDAGASLRSELGWMNAAGRDEYGWTARAGGSRFIVDGQDGYFWNRTYSGAWWTASEYEGNESGAKMFVLGNSSDEFNSEAHYKNEGYSVRCVKD